MCYRRKVHRNLLEDRESQRILERSLLFREFKQEKLEIQKLKWLESEKLGEDIGYEKALLLWAHGHRNSWRAERLRTRFPARLEDSEGQ
jgi:hypothetical protein